MDTKATHGYSPRHATVCEGLSSARSMMASRIEPQSVIARDTDGEEGARTGRKGRLQSYI